MFVHDILFFHQRGYWELFQALRRRNLSTSHLGQAILVQTEASLDDRVLQNALVFVGLLGLNRFRVNIEVFVVYDDPAIEIFLLFLLSHLFFECHAISRLEDRFKVALVREGLPIVLNFVHENRLSIILRPILCVLQDSLCVALLLKMRLPEAFESSNIRLLRMLVPI